MVGIKKKAINLKSKSWEEDSFEKFEIKPDLYSHMAIVSAMESVGKALERGDKIENGFLAKVDAVDLLEQITIARKLMDERDADYRTFVDAARESLKKESLPDDVFSARLANLKFRFLLQLTFGTKPAIVDLLL